MNVSKKSICVKCICRNFLILMGFAISTSECFALSLEVTPEYLTQKADLVILGRVKSRITEERPLISGTTNGISVTYQEYETVITEYEVELEKSYKQDISGSTISVLTPGGILSDGRGWTHSKYFELDDGEKFIAFLVYDKRNEVWRVYSGSQGIYRIEEDSSNPENPFVEPAYTGHVVPRSLSSPPDRDGLTRFRLQELLTTIKRELEK